MILEWIQIFVGLLGAMGILALGFGVLILAKKAGGNVAAAHDDVVVSIKNLNEACQTRSDELLETVLSKQEFKARSKDQKKKQKTELKEKERIQNTADATGQNSGNPRKKRVYVLSFVGDMNASHVHGLREAITALVPLLRKEVDEIVLKVESPGGVVHGYGLAAAQILRLKKAAARLTICVDKVAASGGYMMACLADEIVASPFAIVGSIGAVAGVPNVHRLIKENNIDYLEMTAGKYKRTLSILGEVTEEKKQKFQEQLDDVHEIFKDHVKNQRPVLDLEKVGTGEYWYGVRALELGLVDRLGTSDEVVLDAIEAADVFEVTYKEKESMRDKLAGRLFSAAHRLLARGLLAGWKESVPQVRENMLPEIRA